MQSRLFLLLLHLLGWLLLGPLLQSQQKRMHPEVLLQVLLVQPQLHKQRNHVFAVQRIREHFHGLLELRRAQIGCDVLGLPLFLGQKFKHR